MRLTAERGKPQRIGLSATVKPIEEVAQFLAPDARIVNIGHRREMELAVEVPRDELGPVASNEMWAEIYDRVAELILTHRTTLVFVNTRRLSERVAHALGERLGENVVLPHHGSLSRALRLNAEERLKKGELRAVVATASLELGIDIGSVDLVCQIGSPRSIAVALQRVGRSGHWIGARPHGRLFVTTRDELIECAALVRSIRSGELDRLEIPTAPLDILAQQIVAETAARDCSEDELYDLVRSTYPYRDLARSTFDEVVTMLADGITTQRGRAGAFLHRDQVNGRVRGRRGARLAAITSGGAIPDTAQYAVVAEPDGKVVGSLDEDFAVESLAGDTFLLGTNSWRIKRIEPGRVRVEDAHGAPPSVPFWNGEAPGRTFELSRAVSEVRQEIARDPDRAVTFLTTECGLDDAGAKQAIAYVLAGMASLNSLPSQDTVVAERFFDEAGGMQLVLHAPFGSRINRAWGLALRKRFCRSFNFELQAAATDNGINISLTEQHAFPLELVFEFLKTQTVEHVLTQALLDAPMFTARWRWNASRALAILRFSGGRKVPPPIQRMRSDDLLASVFPRSGRMRREPCWRAEDSGPSAGQRDHRQLPARGHGHRRPQVDPRRLRVRAYPQGSHRHGGAVGVLARNSQRQPVCLSRRRAARRTACAGGSVAAHSAIRRRGRRGHSRSCRHRAGSGGILAGCSKRGRVARRVAHVDHLAAICRVADFLRRAGRRRPRSRHGAWREEVLGRHGTLRSARRSASHRARVDGVARPSHRLHAG